jgi:hypothetical protein
LFKTPIFFGIQNKNFTCLNGCWMIHHNLQAINNEDTQ